MVTFNPPRGGRNAFPVTPGVIYGCFRVEGKAAQSDSHYGVRVKVYCIYCGHTEARVFQQLRAHPPKKHHGCKGKADA